MKHIELLRTLFDGSEGSIGDATSQLHGTCPTQPAAFYLDDIRDEMVWPPSALLRRILDKAGLVGSVLHQHESWEYRESVRNVIVGVVDPDPSRTWAIHMHHTRLPDMDSEYNNEDVATTSVRLVTEVSEIEQLVASQEALAMDKTVRYVGEAITRLVGGEPAKVWQLVDRLRDAQPGLVDWLPAMEACIIGKTLGEHTQIAQAPTPRHRI
jgi:hypothetical protein